MVLKRFVYPERLSHSDERGLFPRETAVNGILSLSVLKRIHTLVLEYSISRRLSLPAYTRTYALGWWVSASSPLVGKLAMPYADQVQEQIC